MSDGTRFVLVDENGVEGLYEYDTLADATKAAGFDHAVIAQTRLDSTLVWTPNAEDTWPWPSR
jgi:hypothetical protein